MTMKKSKKAHPEFSFGDVIVPVGFFAKMFVEGYHPRGRCYFIMPKSGNPADAGYEDQKFVDANYIKVGRWEMDSSGKEVEVGEDD